MKIGIPKETKERENRVALTPTVIRTLIGKGFNFIVEKGAGENSSFSDQDYSEAGATMEADKAKVYGDADIVVKVNAPLPDEVKLMKKEGILISFMFAAVNPELVNAFTESGVTAFSMDAVPRISRAQKMDALSSQSNLAGYKTVILAAENLKKIFPLMMTAAGTLKPAKVVIMGAGVAGLQAIATAKRLGAIVEVSDIRPETKEQVESLGGKFIMVEGDESIKTEGGYVKEISEEFLKKQQELVAKHMAAADIVITTALIPGKKAPVLVTEDTVKKMRNGAVIVDMAVEQGGNCELSELNKTVVKHGVTIIGESNLPSLLSENASELYAKNISELLLHIADGQEGLKYDLNEEIVKGSMITHKGEIVHPSVRKDQ